MPHTITITARKANTTKAIEYLHPNTGIWQDSNVLTNVAPGTYTNIMCRLKGSNPVIQAIWAEQVFVVGSGTTTPPATVAPTITAFSPTTGSANTAVTLAGSGFVSGATAVKFGTLAAASITFISATQLEVVVPANVVTSKLSVTTAGGTAVSTQEFSVPVAQNQLPVANAGADTAIQLPTNQVVLQGFGTDNDGTIASYAWRQVTGPNTASGLPATTASVVVGNLVAGIYQFGLITRDDQNAPSAEDRVMVTVNAAATPGNQLPVANAGADDTITLPTSSAALSGKATDADGTIASVRWSQTSGPATVTFSNANVLNPTITGLTVAGTYVFTLVATDNRGDASVADQVVLTVNPAPNNYTDRVNTVMAGNSIVFGYGAETSYPAVMTSLLPSNYTITNIGQSGWTMTQILAQRGQIDGLYDSRPGAVNVLMLQEGINSFAQGQSVDDFFAMYNEFLGYFRAKGWKVVGVTPTPYNYYPNGVPGMQQDLIARMKAQASTLYDALLDWSPNPHVGYFTPFNSAAFVEYFPDGLHPSTKAQKLMGRMAYDMMNYLFNQVAVPDQSVYPTDVSYAGTPMVLSSDRYQVVVEETLKAVYGQPGIGQRDNWIYGEKVMTAGPGLRGAMEFSLNQLTKGFVGISERTGQVQAGQQTVAVQVDNNRFRAWVNFIQDWGDVGAWGAAFVRVRIEVYQDLVKFSRVGETEAFFTFGAPVFPCRFSLIPDGSGFEACYYNLREE